MFKYLLVLVSLVLLGVAFSFLMSKSTSENPKSYTITKKAFEKPITIDSKAKVIAALMNETIFIKDGTTHCIQKALFWNFSTGYVSCGHQAGEDVYHTYNNDRLPEKMHFTLRELDL